LEKLIVSAYRTIARRKIGVVILNKGGGLQLRRQLTRRFGVEKHLAAADIVRIPDPQSLDPSAPGADPGGTAGPYQATGIKICEVDTESAIVWTRLTRRPERLGADRPLPLVRIEAPDPESGPETGPKKGKRKDRDRREAVPIVEFPGGSTVETIEGAVPGREGQVRVRYKAESSSEWLTTEWEEVEPQHDFTRQVPLTGLSAGTHYEIEVEARAGRAAEPGSSVTGRFRTAPAADVPARVVFAVSTCQAYVDQDAPGGGFKIYDHMLALDPDFFVHTGDILYYDQLAKTEALARWHWQRMFSLPTNLEFHRRVASYFMKDDHDTWVNECWSTLETSFMGDFTFQQGQQLFLEQVGMGEKTYRTVRWGQDLQIWMVEGRDYRKPNRMPDGPRKTLWGRKQKVWFKQSVLASDATFRILISPTPVVGPDMKEKSDNLSNEGFATEGNEIRDFLASQNNMVVVCGDRHWQYVSQDERTGVREYSCGPASDEHASGWSNDLRYPEHRYLNVVGGFLAGTVERVEERAVLTLRHYSVDGEVLNEDRLVAED
jgi:alkaline phosphatase D